MHTNCIGQVKWTNLISQIEIGIFRSGIIIEISGQFRRRTYDLFVIIIQVSGHYILSNWKFSGTPLLANAFHFVFVHFVNIFYYYGSRFVNDSVRYNSIVRGFSVRERYSSCIINILNTRSPSHRCVECPFNVDDSHK